MKTSTLYIAIYFPLLLISCNLFKEDDPIPTPSCPGYVLVCDGPFLAGPCWEEWRECPPPWVPEYKVYALFNSFDNWYFTAGETILIELIYDNSPFDSISFTICGNIFERRILPDQSLSGILDYVVLHEYFTIDEEITLGFHQYSMRVWKDGALMNERIKDIFIHSNFEIEESCKIDGKRTMVFDVPLNTPQNSKIQIVEVKTWDYGRWDYEDDSLFTLTPIDDHLYCIALDFRGNEYFRLVLDDVQCAQECCMGDCNLYQNGAGYNINGVTIYEINGWSNSKGPGKTYVCKSE